MGIIRKLDIQTHLKQFYVDDFEHLHIAVRYLIEFLNQLLIRPMMKKATYLTVLKASDLSGTLTKVLTSLRLSQLRKLNINSQRLREKWSSLNYTQMCYS